MSLFLESIKIQNGQAINLSWHQARVNQTFTNFFPNQTPFRLSDQIIVKKIDPQIIFKCRIIYNNQIHKIELVQYKPRIITNFKIVSIEDFEYQYKFADRTYFDKLFATHPEFDDFILVRNGFLTDSTYANLVFENSNGYFTPTSCLLPGTMRAKLIAENKIQLAEIKITDLEKYQRFYLINAFLDDSFSSPFDIQLLFPRKF